MKLFPHGGYAVLTHAGGKSIFRCPHRLRHRPSHCDLLHLDVWHNGMNLLRDGGSYSYNCEPPWQDYFKSTAAHNTVQFDDHEQMPKLSRFLFGKWPRLEVEADLKSTLPSVRAAYTDWQGCTHGRKVAQIENGIEVIDSISGFQHKAVLRWRLAPECRWTLDNNECRSAACRLKITCEDADLQIELGDGWESLHYMEKWKIPVLEATVQQASTIITQIALF